MAYLATLESPMPTDEDLIVIESSEFVIEPLPRIKIRFNDNGPTRLLAGKTFEAVALGDTYFLSASTMPAPPTNADVISLIEPSNYYGPVYFNNSPEGTSVNFGRDFNEKLRRLAEEEERLAQEEEDREFAEKLRHQQEFIRQCRP
jgi:hypothetical protein